MSMNYEANKQGLKELTFRGIIIGALITVVFTASNVYLGLKVGLTFSSAIPSAVISMAVLRYFSKSNILENNMIQTQASAAGTLSSVIFILPGLLMIGYWTNLPLWETLLVCAAGGMLGVIFTIPLRHAMVVKSDLPYPEGVAAAEILKAGCGAIDDDEVQSSETTKKDSGFKDIIFGGIISAVLSFVTSGFRLVSGSASVWAFSGRAAFQFPIGFSLALLSAGYLIGITAGIAILIGLLISWGVAVPILTSLTPSSSTMALPDLAISLWANKVRFIGAGTLAIAALWTLIQLIKPVIEGMKISMRSIGAQANGQKLDRTEQDLSPKFILGWSILMFFVLIGTFYSFIADSSLPATSAWLLVVLATVFVFIIGFIIAAACGYMAGLVGSSASPISGIGIIAVTVVSLLLVAVGHSNQLFSSPENNKFGIALAIFITSAVLAVASISNDNLQDLKTGYLVKATPWRQQVALLIGCIVGAAVIAPVLELLYHAYGFSGAMPRIGMDPTQALSAPQATIMTTIAKGVFSNKLDWSMISIGVGLGVVIILIDLLLKRFSSCRLPALAVGMGLYLPPEVASCLVIGAILAWLVSLRVKAKTKNSPEEYNTMNKAVERKGTLIASGFIVGESLVGIIMAIIIVISVTNGHSETPLDMSHWLMPIFGSSLGNVQEIAGLVIFIIICIALVRRVLGATKKLSSE